MATSSQRFYSPSDIADAIESLEKVHGRNRPFIYGLFLICVLAAMTAVLLLKVDLSVAGVGQIRPELQRLQVIPSVSGYIESLHVSDNQLVTEGQTLLRFESRAVVAKIRHLQTTLQETTQTIADLETLSLSMGELIRVFESHKGESDTVFVDFVQNTPQMLQVPRLLKQLANFSGEMERVRLDWKKQVHDFHRYERLKERDFVSTQEYENHLHGVETSRRRLQLTLLQQASEWQAELADRRLTLSNLESELSQLLEQQQLYELKAPMDGIAIGFRGLQEGLFIAQGQVIGEISPESRLLAEVYLSPRDVGFVSQGQQTKILVDAFPHTEWGTLTGKVKEISRDFIQLGDQIAFRVTIELDQLGLRSRKGVKVDVKRGMTVSSRFVIRERTLFSILFSKMSDAFDPREITQE